MRAVIIANGQIDNYQYIKNLINKDDFIICADGAIKHCIEMDILPDYWIGDFDSCCFDEYFNKYAFLKNIKIIKLNPEKDLTDTHAACDIAIDLGYKEILILCGIGSRFDHSISNVHLLEYLLKKGINASLRNERNTIRILKDHILIPKDKKYLSLIPLDSNVKVLKTIGLKYPIENIVLNRFLSLSVSNEIISEYADIYIQNGLMLTIESDD